ncbi:FadR/GntR family transcriptional regulator [Lacicoccus alkaliphilus]|uniref:GntR family transcriptional regulator, transcriptional repressor for pyruvate dehydrogenase complex n=1 Tax=Lacicoccus alkaliphilus DSM 16010 TaxID=1123231 RepID=A0A1M7CYG7_9BACL|nr:FadR/GntR family transcriptional regulator [Salinicoccus alkaliphilus]SHL72133.1 GntR family transcriptional regulator, transcriptional repressor for pyruvate dehydrogenase complex [Salinicoccus alkaliphilus DSM 16010]
MQNFMEHIEVKSIPEQIADHFKAEIMKKRLNPGDKLPSLEKLSETLQVSKPTVNEALKHLQESGLVKTVKGRNGGYFVTESYEDKLMKNMYEIISFSLTFNELKSEDLLEIRKMIEIPCAGLAAEKRTKENIEKLEEIGRLMQSPANCSLQETLDLDLKFHMAIAECTQNPLAKNIINAITKSYLDSNMEWHIENKHYITERTGDILTAIKQQDVEGAKAAMENHMSNFLHFKHS